MEKSNFGVPEKKIAALPKVNRTRHMPSLDGWRGIAILSVLACHGSAGMSLKNSPIWNAIRPILARGYHGVDLFFGISGFLICTRLLEGEDQEGKIDLRTFYIRRFFRIAPLFLLYFSILAALKFAGQLDLNFHSWLSGLLLIQTYSVKSTDINWYVGHIWSLAVEEHFYLIFPALLVLIGQKSKARAGILTLSALGVALWRSLEYKYQLLPQLLPGIGFYSRTDIVLDFLLFSAGMAVVWRKDLMPGLLKDLVQNRYSALIFALLYALVLWKEPHFSMLLEAILISMLLVSTLDGQTPLLSPILKNPILAWVGKISYSLYLWNNLFLLPLEEKPLPALNWMQTPITNGLLLFGLSALSYTALEKPMINLGRRLSKPRTD